MAEIQITTTQNVNLNFRVADVGERILAYLIDALIKGAYWFVALYIVVFLEDNLNIDILPAYEEDYWGFIAVFILLGLPVIFYTLLQEVLLQGQTFGKRLFKIKVIRIDGGRANLGDFFIRWAMRIFDISFLGGGIAFITIFNNKNHQRLGDMAAGTCVVSLKNKTTINNTILVELKDSYIPTYANVIMLSDNDVRIIKDSYEGALKYNSNETILRLKKKIIEVTNIQPKINQTDKEFLSTILKDFNFFTQKNQ